MPKKDYGEPTRRSERLGAPSLERSVKHEEVEEPALSTSRPESSPASPEPVEPAAPIDKEPEEPVASIESDQYDSAEETHVQIVVKSKPPRNPEQTHHRTTPLPAPETNMSATNNNNDNAAGGEQDNLANITTILQRLMDRMDRLETPPGNRTRSLGREITPDESVFGGKAFKPTGHAAKPEFNPYGEDHNSTNPSYDNRAKQAQYKPGVFNGDRDSFDRWVVQIADKCRCDDETFKVERDRIVMIVSYLEGTPAQLVNSRYISTENPFRSAAEVIATLSGVYQDNNQAGRAREELGRLMYDPKQGEDIKQFIGRVNGLADRANIMQMERKSTLNERVPAYMGSGLLDYANDPNVTYEAFCQYVANAAYTQERAHREFTQKKKAKAALLDDRPARHDGRPARRKSHSRQPTGKKEARVRETHRSGHRSPDRARSDERETRTCFLCKKEGHIARDCPDRRDIARICKELDDEEGQARNGQEVADCSSDSSSDSGEE